MATNPKIDVTTQRASYFVIKCGSLKSLSKCITSGKWAFRKRSKPPQPKDILEEAHSKGNVILIFSVNNQHGWHGYCQSIFPSSIAQDPATERKLDLELATSKNHRTKADTTDCQPPDDEWCYFPVTWLKHFQSFNSYGCLPLDKTGDLCLLDGSSVNKARNWQEMSEPVGQQMCDLIDLHLADMTDRRQALEKEKLNAIKAKESFFEAEENSVDFGAADIATGWLRVIQKVETELGKVILACPFGSQRYNCSLPDSDSDILVIYQAKTEDMLGLDTPPQTIKNSHCAKMDYTILELQRYCELLVSGDPRYVETLFIEEESILAFASESWRQLCEKKNLLLTQECLDKYLREAKGTKGLKLFHRWTSEIKEGQTPQKVNKLAYIILRLLQGGRDMLKDGCLQVYREDSGKERQELLDARLGRFDVATMTVLFDRYLEEIEDLRADHHFKDISHAKLEVQAWLVQVRLQDL